MSDSTTIQPAGGEESASDEPHVGVDSERSERSKPTKSGAELKVTQTRSGIGAKPKQRGTLRALGLGRIGKSNTLPDRPEIRGMVAKVPHLVKVEEV
jgi:large subunit ribosomal protein L30